VSLVLHGYQKFLNTPTTPEYNSSTHVHSSSSPEIVNGRISPTIRDDPIQRMISNDDLETKGIIRITTLPIDTHQDGSSNEIAISPDLVLGSNDDDTSAESNDFYDINDYAELIYASQEEITTEDGPEPTMESSVFQNKSTTQSLHRVTTSEAPPAMMHIVSTESNEKKVIKKKKNVNTVTTSVSKPNGLVTTVPAPAPVVASKPSVVKKASTKTVIKPPVKPTPITRAMPVPTVPAKPSAPVKKAPVEVAKALKPKVSAVIGVQQLRASTEGLKPKASKEPIVRTESVKAVTSKRVVKSVEVEDKVTAALLRKSMNLVNTINKNAKVTKGTVKVRSSR
jgi:hypothetical protein